MEAEAATSGLVGQPSLCDYPQALGTPDHVGRACPTLHGMQVAAVLPQDPSAQAEVDANGFIQNNLGALVTSGDFVAIPTHLGEDPFHTDDAWGVSLWRWTPSVAATSHTLQHVADLTSSWLAVDTAVKSIGFATNGYVQSYPLAFANGTLYAPQASAQLRKIDPATGATLATIDPFAGTSFSGDPRLITAGGLTVAPGGVIWYTATAWPNGTPVRFGDDPRGSWLVRVAPDNSTRIVSWLDLATTSAGVAQRDDLCTWPFGTSGTPQPTGPDSQPPRFKCGFQRPMTNAAPAIRPTDGHLILYSGGNNNIWEMYLLDVDPVVMVTAWAMPMREHFHQACGVRIPLTGSGDFGDTCDVITAHGTTHLGFDPQFNRPASLRAGDLDSNQVFCTRNGTCCVGGYDGGFAFGGDYDARGATVCFAQDGSLFSTNEEFGWDTTPTVWEHDGTTTLVQDLNQFSDLVLQTARYTPTFERTATSNVPIDFDAVAVEFIDENNPVDTDGHSYGYNANGHLYQFGADGQVSDLVALIDPATGAPCAMDGVGGFMARDRNGRVYVPACGNVYVVASAGAASVTPPTRAELARIRPSAQVVAGMRAKATAAATAPIPSPPVEPPPSTCGYDDPSPACKIPQSANPGEVECSPDNGCTGGGGGGGSCSALCVTSADCFSACQSSSYSCIGATPRLPGFCSRTLALVSTVVRPRTITDCDPAVDPDCPGNGGGDDGNNGGGATGAGGGDCIGSRCTGHPTCPSPVACDPAENDAGNGTYNSFCSLYSCGTRCNRQGGAAHFGLCAVVGDF